jgi:hypothetical protein
MVAAGISNVRIRPSFERTDDHPARAHCARPPARAS